MVTEPEVAADTRGTTDAPAERRDVLQRRIDDPASPANAYVHGVAPAAADGAPGLDLKSVAIGDSICVSGCCLTVTRLAGENPDIQVDVNVIAWLEMR